MRKKFTASILSLATLFLLLLSSVTFAAHLEDKAGFLQETEKQELLQYMNELEEAYNIEVGIITVKKLPKGHDSRNFTIEMRDKYLKKAENGTIMLTIVDGEPGNRKYYISTNPAMQQIITDDAGFPYMEEQILPYLKDSDFNGAFITYLNVISDEMDYYIQEGEPYDPSNEFSICAAILGLALAVGCGWGFTEYLKGRMSNVSPVNEADEYLDKDSIKLGNHSDVFLYTSVTRTKRSSDNDSSSSSGSSGGGGGGSF